MKFFSFLILTLLPVAQVQAEESKSASPDPVNRGLELAPLLKCPAVPDAYSKMITDLNLLKTAVKKESACEPLAQEVQDLQALLGPKRDEVKALIEKSKTQSLTTQELESVRKYVEDVTKRVLSTAELFSRNNYCFIEDKKNLTLSDLASITLDATALAKTVAGPWAVPISLGGQALAGIFQGLNTVVKSRRGYDFRLPGQRQSYVQSLCAYYNYRQDIEHLLYPQQRAQQLRDLGGKLSVQLSGIETNCTECSSLAPKVVSLLNEEAGPARGRAKARTAEQVNSHVEQINSAYVYPLGTYTLKTLTTLKWIDTELERVVAESGDDSAIGRDLLSEIKADIDRFMFEVQGPSFVQFEAQKGYDLFRQFSSYVLNEGNSIQSQAYVLGRKNEDFIRMNEADVIKTISSIEADANKAGLPGLASRAADYRRKSIELYERTRIAASVVDTYCNFFQKAGVYNSKLQYSCEGPVPQTLRRYLKRLEGNDSVPQPALLAPSKEYVVDWVNSLSKAIDTINNDPNRYQRKREVRRN